jgi:hypothetical protein
VPLPIVESSILIALAIAILLMLLVPTNRG